MNVYKKNLPEGVKKVYTTYKGVKVKLIPIKHGKKKSK